MQFIETELPGVIRVLPKLIGDQRGFFMEFYQHERFREHGIDAEFVQDNLSRSQQGVLRGLHYQVRQPQGKLVTVLNGEIFDVAVDLRRGSSHFGKWIGVTLTDRTREAVYLPPGFAHGFYVLSETADVFYKCTNLYAPEHERTLLWSDPDIDIDWPLSGEPILSEKDRRGIPLQQAECYG